MKSPFIFALILLGTACAYGALPSESFHSQDAFPAPPIRDFQHDHWLFEGRQITFYEISPSVRFVGIINRWSSPHEFEELCGKHSIKATEVIFSVHENLYVTFEATSRVANLAFREEAFERGILKGCFEASDEKAYQIAKRIDRRDQGHQIIEESALAHDGLLGAVCLELLQSEPGHRLFVYADLGDDALTQNEQDIILRLGACINIFLGVSHFDNPTHNPVFNAVSATLEGGPSSLSKLSAAILENDDASPHGAAFLTSAAAYCVEGDETAIVTKLGHLPADFSEESAVRAQELPASIRLNEDRQIVGFDEDGNQTHLISGIIPEAYIPWRYFDIDQDGRKELILLHGNRILFANFDSHTLLSIQPVICRNGLQIGEFTIPEKLVPIGVSCAPNERSLRYLQSSLICASADEPELVVSYNVSQGAVINEPTFVEFIPTIVISEELVGPGEDLDGPIDIPESIPYPSLVYAGDENGTRIWVYRIDSDAAHPIPGLWKAYSSASILSKSQNGVSKADLHRYVDRIHKDPHSSFSAKDLVAFNP